ncbi:MAG: hypothetical protein KGL35_32835 [Bradyrhizobium sp.]|nr:hypothetical protein [Bradyrhizobium sp.]
MSDKPMTKHKFKDGDRAMVTLAGGFESRGEVRLRCHYGIGYISPAIHPDCLEPLPPAMTAAEANLIDKAIAWEERPTLDRETALVDAIHAVNVERNPPTATEELVALVKSCVKSGWWGIRDRTRGKALVEQIEREKSDG